jgi:predicted GNAT superfamily acetyltransferase
MSSPGEPSGSNSSTRLLDPAALGFVGDEETGWQRPIRGRAVHFRILCSLDDLVHAERLQEEVFGVTERDLIPANELIVVPETGGAVIAAFLSDDPTWAAGVLLGWGGFVGRPRIVSDFLAVRPEARNVGLAAELKRLQAGIASSRGFQEIVWTVDPLRAANARLNFGKLGAVSRTYEIDRYGSTFATGLYGGMPSDRIHVTWDLTAPRVVARLLGRDDDEFSAATPNPPRFTAGTNHDTVIVTIPADIDALLAANTAAALAWRFRLRDTLIQAFTEGLAITGFRPAADGDPAYLLERIRGQKD